MEIEENFGSLINSLLDLYKNTLKRNFYFSFLNIHYETTVFKAQQTYGKQKVIEKAPAKSIEEEKVNTRLEEALETAKKVYTGARPLEVKKKVEVKSAREVKKPSEVKKANESKIGVGKRPAVPASKPQAVSINPLECYRVTSILVNPELMIKYQDLKGRFSSSFSSNLGGLSQGKKAEVTAKKSFLTKLNKKFTSKNIRTDVDEVVAKTYAIYKILSEIQLIFNDEDILQSFFELASSPVQKYSSKSEISKLCKDL